MSVEKSYKVFTYRMYRQFTQQCGVRHQCYQAKYVNFLSTFSLALKSNICILLSNMVKLTRHWFLYLKKSKYQGVPPYEGSHLKRWCLFYVCSLKYQPYYLLLATSQQFCFSKENPDRFFDI